MILLYVLLALNFIRLPKVAAEWTHDTGSQMSFEFYAHARYQFGVDVIQNVGPYGYLQYPRTYSGILPVPKLAFGILFGLVLAWAVMDARKYFPTAGTKVLWFLAVFFSLVMPGEELDPVTDLFIFLAGHHLLRADPRRTGGRLADAVLCIALGVLSLLKSTNVMLVVLLMGLILVERVRSRRFLDLAANLAGVGFTALFLWVLAGQKIANMAAFMRGAMAFSKGYNDALSTVGKPEIIWLGLVVVALFAVVNVLRWWWFRTYWHRLLTTIFEAACLFIIWKHSYVRSGHEVFFWASMIPAAPLLFLAHEQSIRWARSQPAPGLSQGRGFSPVKFRMDWFGMACAGVAVLCTIWASRIEKDNKSYSNYASLEAAIGSPFERMGANFMEMAGWPGHLRGLKAELEQNRSVAALPQVKKAVGDATIDEFGFLPGAILLNELHYDPRPMPINFGATTGLLMTRNAEFYQNDATAPEFLLANIGQIDGRLGPQDDALALPEVLQHYQPLLADHIAEQSLILLKRMTNRPALAWAAMPDARTIKWGEAVAVPPRTNGNMIWCAVDVKYSLRGRAQSFLLHPPRAFILMESPTMRFGPIRVLPSGASTGFLLKPLILNPVDFLASYGINVQPASALTPEFDAIRFVAEDQDCFQPEIRVSFSTIEPKK